MSRNESELRNIWAGAPNDPEGQRWRLSLPPEERAIIRQLDEDLADMLEWDSCACLRIVKREEFRAEDEDAAMNILRAIIWEDNLYFFEFSPEEQKLKVSFLGI